MTSKEAEALVKAFQSTRWPRGIEASVWPEREEGSEYHVMLSWEYRDQEPTFCKVVTPFAIHDLQRYVREATKYRDKAARHRPPGNKPPILTKTAPEAPREDWVAQSVVRMCLTDAPNGTVKRAKNLLLGLEIIALECPDVDEIGGAIWLRWDTEDKVVSVVVSKESATIRVEGPGAAGHDGGRRVVWASDVHLWHRSRAVTSLRTWLGWAFPRAAEDFAQKVPFAA